LILELLPPDSLLLQLRVSDTVANSKLGSFVRKEAEGTFDSLNRRVFG
jgi:hypothetical protein